MAPTSRLRFAAALLAVFASAPATAGGSDPDTVLKDIYGRVMTMCGGDGNGQAYDLDAMGKTYFTPSLAKTIATQTASGDLDYDILVDGNDCKVGNLKLTIVGGGDTTSVGKAEFENFGETRVIELHMLKSGGDWRVGKIVYRHWDFSLD